VQRLRRLDWEELFGKHRLGECIEAWRSDWLSNFDFVLIDSRTGFSDIGNICTIIFPNVLVLIFTTSDQSIDGIAEVMHRSRAAQSKLPVERGRLAAVPVLSRDERENEYTLSQEWISRIAKKLGEFYRDWLPREITPDDVLRKLYIPQIAYWSFGERLPVIEKEEEIGDARSIVAAYARLARFLSDQLDWTKIEGHKEAFPEVIKRAEVVRQQAEEVWRQVEAEKNKAIQQQRSLLYNFFPSLAVFIILAVGLWYSQVNPNSSTALILLRPFFYGILGSCSVHIVDMYNKRQNVSRNKEESFYFISPFTLFSTQFANIMLGGFSVLFITLFIKTDIDAMTGVSIGVASYVLWQKLFPVFDRMKTVSSTNEKEP
jgi:hypothetical protein